MASCWGLPQLEHDYRVAGFSENAPESIDAAGEPKASGSQPIQELLVPPHSSRRGVGYLGMAESDRERLPDIYYPLDYPVLVEIDGGSRPAGPIALQPERIAAQLREPPASVHAAVGQLWRGAGGTLVEAAIRDLRELARWTGPDSRVQQLLAVLVPATSGVGGG